MSAALISRSGYPYPPFLVLERGTTLRECAFLCTCTSLLAGRWLAMNAVAEQHAGDAAQKCMNHFDCTQLAQEPAATNQQMRSRAQVAHAKTRLPSYPAHVPRPGELPGGRARRGACPQGHQAWCVLALLLVPGACASHLCSVPRRCPVDHAFAYIRKAWVLRSINRSTCWVAAAVSQGWLGQNHERRVSCHCTSPAPLVCRQLHVHAPGAVLAPHRLRHRRHHWCGSA